MHDRKPLELDGEMAREWLDPATSPARAGEIVASGCRPAEYFRWFKVSKAAGNVKNQGAHLIEPLNDDHQQGDLEL